MEGCNRKCLWNMEGTCVSESLDEIGDDSTFMSDNCIGYLREDMEEHMLDMKSEILVFCPDGVRGKRVAEYIANMSYKSTLQMYEDTIGKYFSK